MDGVTAKGVILLETKGDRFLFVTSILMIIGGATGIIIGIIAVLGASVLAAMLGEAASFGLLMVGSILIWAGGVTGLIAGITGVRNAERAKKTIACLVFCLLAAALTVIGNILTVTGGGEINAVSSITGLLLPGLCLIAERKSRRSP